MPEKVSIPLFMHSSKLRSYILILFFALFFLFLILNHSDADLINRIVALVGEDAITLADLDKKYSEERTVNTDISRRDVLDKMVDRLLIKQEAMNLKITGINNDDIIRQYIDTKIRAYIRIRNEYITQFYNENKKSFSDQDILYVGNEIERILIERETSKNVNRLINQLRKESYIKILL